jgi:hypothetical protein
VFTSPLFFEDYNALEFSQLEIISLYNQSYQVPMINITIVPQIPTYSLIVNNQYGYISCTYSQDGCFPLRIFYNVENSNAYNNYKDLTACITLNNQQYTFSGQTTNFLDELFGGGQKDSALALFMILIVVIVSALFIGGLTENVMMGVGIGGVLGVAVAMMLAYFGWIPVWWLILFFIIAGGIVVVMVKNMLS